MQIECADQDVTGRYPGFLEKNLRRGARGSVRAVRLIDVTDDIPDDAPVRRKRASVVIAYASDLADNWYVQITRAYPVGGNVVLVAFAEFPDLAFEKGSPTAEDATGLDTSALRTLVLRHASGIVPNRLLGTPSLRGTNVA